MYEEKNTGSNLPAQIDIFATKGNEYKFQFIAKGKKNIKISGGGNKIFIFKVVQIKHIVIYLNNSSISTNKSIVKSKIINDFFR
jgi:hypothetical protein